MKTWIEETFPEGQRQFDDQTNNEIVKEVLSKFRDEVEKRFMRSRINTSRGRIMNEILEEIGI